MTKLIDGDRLEAFLDTQDGLDALLVKLVLNDFEYQPPQTPMKDIDVPTKLKVRAQASGTSWEAAYEQTKGKSQILYQAIYRALTRRGPMTDDQIRVTVRPVTDAHGFAPESVTMRRGELVKAGWVRATGERRAGDSGSPMQVWEAVPEMNS